MTPETRLVPAGPTKDRASAATCHWSRAAGRCDIVVAGELDLAALQNHGLSAAMSAYRSDEPVDVVLDLGDVSFIDSAGLSWLTSVRATVTLADRRLRVSRTSAAVDQVLEMSGLARYFTPTAAPVDPKDG